MDSVNDVDLDNLEIGHKRLNELIDEVKVVVDLQVDYECLKRQFYHELSPSPSLSTLDQRRRTCCPKTKKQ